VRASGTKRARDKREGTDKRKRGHSGVTLPRVLLRLSFASGNRYADLGLSPRARPEVLFISVGLSPSLVRTYSRALALVYDFARTRVTHAVLSHARIRA